MENDDQQPTPSEQTPFERFEAMMKTEAKRIVQAVPSPVKKKRRKKT